MGTTFLKLTVTEMEKNPEKWERFELYNGEPVELPYTKAIHSRILMQIGYKLHNWIESERGYGDVYAGKGGIKFSDEIRYCYDLAWSDIRVTEDEIPTKSFPLMIEIVSEGNEINKLLSKVDDYLKFGAKEVWLVYPNRKSIQVYYPDNTARTFHLEDTISPEYLKGFTLSLKEIF